jgi:hypothetical protein
MLLTHQMLTPVPDALTPSIVIGLSLTWLPVGLAAGIVVARRRMISSGVNIALVWVAAGSLAIVVASALGTLENGAPELTVGAAVTISLVFALLGGGATMSGATGVRGLGIGSAVLITTWFAAIQVGLTIPGLVENIANIANFPNLWPPDFSWAVGEGTWWWIPSWDFGSPTLANPLIETFQIAVIASLIGCLVALPISFLASKVTAPGRISYLLSKGFMNVTRTIPDLFWAFRRDPGTILLLARDHVQALLGNHRLRGHRAARSGTGDGRLPFSGSPCLGFSPGVAQLRGLCALCL